MKNSRFIPTIGKKVRKLVGGFYPLARFEREYVKKCKLPSPPPIFIIGAARSGSTLLYQLMTYYLKCSYFSNFASVFYKYPVMITSITRPFVRGYEDNSFQSDYGFTKGLWAPSEAGGIFNYWFGGHDKIDSDFIRDSVYKLSAIGGGPFVCKNLVNSTRIEDICDIFPSAFIIHMKRDFMFNAQSIILSLRNKRVEMGAIASAKEIICGDEIMVAVKYLCDIESRIRTAIKKQNGNHYIQINYSDLCDNYPNDLKKIRRAYERTGYKMENKNFDKKNIIKNEQKRLGEDDWQILLEYSKGLSD